MLGHIRKSGYHATCTSNYRRGISLPFTLTLDDPQHICNKGNDPSQHRQQNSCEDDLPTDNWEYEPPFHSTPKLKKFLFILHNIESQLLHVLDVLVRIIDRPCVQSRLQSSIPLQPSIQLCLGFLALLDTPLQLPVFPTPRLTINPGSMLLLEPDAKGAFLFLFQ